MMMMMMMMSPPPRPPKKSHSYAAGSGYWNVHLRPCKRQ